MNWIEQLGPDHLVARLEVGWRPSRLRQKPAVVSLLAPVAAVLASRWFPHRPGMEGLLCFGAMVWTWTMLGVVALGAWHGQSVVPFGRPRHRGLVLEVRGGRITVDGVDQLAVEVGEERVVLAGRPLHLCEALPAEDVALIESALAEALELDRRRTGGPVPDALRAVTLEARRRRESDRGRG